MRNFSKDFIFLALCVLVGAALRLDFLYASHAIIDADEAIVGLMAKHITEGKPIPIFYYGQYYMGSLEAICVAGLFQVFGISTLALKAVPLVFSLVLIVLMFELGKVLGGKRVAYGAAALTAIPPAALVVWSSMARGGFIEVIVLGAAALLAAYRWSQQKSGNPWRLFLASFLLGVGWWVNNQIIYFFVPVGLLVLLEFRKRPKSAALWLPSLLLFLLGSLPFWWYNIENNFASFGLFQGVRLKDALDHLLGVFETALPIILGARRFWQDRENITWIDTLILLLSSGIVVVFIAARWKELVSLGWLAKRQTPAVELLLCMLIGAIGIFSYSSFGWLVQAPRYLLPLYVPWLALTAWTVQQVHQRMAWVGWSLTALLIALNLHSSYGNGRAIPGQPYIFASERVSADNTELIAWLTKHNIHWVRTNYWVGYRLAFETKEQVRFLVTQEPFQTRIQEWEDEGSLVPEEDVPYVLSPTQGKLIRKALQILDFSFNEATLSGYTVLSDLHPPKRNLQGLGKEEFSLESDLNSDLLSYAEDSDPNTRWGSGKAQRPGMHVDIVLPQPTKVRAFEYDLSHWCTDYPRGFTVSYQDESGAWHSEFGPEDWPALRYLFENRSKLTFYLPGTLVTRIRLEETGSDPVFDWSIGDLRVFK